MLATKYNLKGDANFRRVEKEGKVFQSDTFGLAFYEREDKEDPRFGFIVSNKISNESTLRNRVKRALKAAVRYELTLLKNGVDVVFLAKQNILRKTTEDIMNEVRAALARAKLYK
jgi:ribonuclease P protein component